VPGPWSIGGAKRRRLRRESPARSTGSELRSGDGKALKPRQDCAARGVLNPDLGLAGEPNGPNIMGVSMSSALAESGGLRIGV
jgi:hypothetical protein